MAGVTFNNGVQVVPAVIASDPDKDGYVYVFAPEGDSNAVKRFTAKKSSSGQSDYEQA
jgi:hypothetical protein